MSAEEKVYIKDTLLKMVQNGTNPILQEANHIKDQLAKIIVELIKVCSLLLNAFTKSNGRN